MMEVPDQGRPSPTTIGQSLLGPSQVDRATEGQPPRCTASRIIEFPQDGH